MPGKGREGAKNVGRTIFSKRAFMIGSVALTACPWTSHAGDSAANAGQDSLAALTAMADASYSDASMTAGGLVYDETAPKVRKAAEKGDPQAENNLGVSYILGLGTEKDVPTGIDWLNKAARQGDGTALSNLALLYHTGLGVPRDDAHAVDLYLQAAAKGESATTLAFMYCRGEGTQQNFQNAAALFASGANAGGTIDAYEAALASAIGRGAPVNLELACFFLLVATRFKGFALAVTAQNLVAASLSPAQMKAAVSRFTSWRQARPIP